MWNSASSLPCSIGFCPVRFNDSNRMVAGPRILSPKYLQTLNSLEYAIKTLFQENLGAVLAKIHSLLMSIISEMKMCSLEHLLYTH